jgi:hypothetical protein
MEAKIAKLRESAAEGDAQARKLVALFDGITSTHGGEASPAAMIAGLMLMLQSDGARHAHEVFALLAVILPLCHPDVVRAASPHLFSAIDTAVRVSCRSAGLPLRAMVHPRDACRPMHCSPRPLPVALS